MRESVLSKYCEEWNDSMSIHSLHGTIGGKNRQFADVVHSQFNDPREFIAKWLEGFFEHVSDGRYSPMRKLLKDEEFLDYTFTFLERNFFRNFKARTRYKPHQSLWSLWFGDNKMTWDF